MTCSFNEDILYLRAVYTVVLIKIWQQNVIPKTVGFGGWGRGKIIPTIYTVSLFNPMVKFPRLRCIQFVSSLLWGVILESRDVVKLYSFLYPLGLFTYPVGYTYPMLIIIVLILYMFFSIWNWVSRFWKDKDMNIQSKELPTK